MFGTLYSLFIPPFSNVAAIMMYEAMRQQNFPNLCEFEPETMKGKDLEYTEYEQLIPSFEVDKKDSSSCCTAFIICSFAYSI